MSLSVCMIVKNEAANLPACLESVRDLADEIWVFDTGSTDNTVSVAESLGAKVKTVEWTHDFADARNASLTKATGEWILVLDADETLTAAGRDCLQKVMANEPVGHSDQPIPIQDSLLITWLRREVGAQQSPYTQVARLFRNHPALRFSQPYHETIDDSVEVLMVAEPHWQIAQLGTVAMDHTGYTLDEITAQAKFERARGTLERYLAEHPDDAYFCNKLGALYGQLGDWAKCLSLLEHGLAVTEPDPVTAYELRYHAGLACRALNRLTRAVDYYRQALASPILPRIKLGAYINLGSLLKHQGQLNEAVALFEAAIAIDDTQAITYYNLGVAQRARGYLDEALTAYQAAIALAPNSPEIYQNLGVAYFKLGQLPESLQAFNAATQLYTQSGQPDKAFKIQQSIRQLGIKS
ncbi:MAG: tetratricopeptide repeat protein [Cyanobacteria bacterium P01_D01_bin.44]